MIQQIAGREVEVDEEGYLKNLEDWTREVAEEIAQQEGIQLTDKHWEVIQFLQDSYRNDRPLSIRSIGKRGPVSIKEFYELFPGAPLKKAAKIAGIPKPASCV